MFWYYFHLVSVLKFCEPVVNIAKKNKCVKKKIYEKAFSTVKTINSAKLPIENNIYCSNCIWQYEMFSYNSIFKSSHSWHPQLYKRWIHIDEYLLMTQIVFAKYLSCYFHPHDCCSISRLLLLNLEELCRSIFNRGWVLFAQ